MTAVVGILNKESIALAADSAVTISGSGNRKIFNRANKIFRISNHQPIGVMIYNSASFMGTPLEVILKMYREKLGSLGFSTVKEYQEDFVAFIKEKNCFTTEQQQNDFLTEYFALVFELISRQSLEYLTPLEVYQLKDQPDQVMARIREKIAALLEQNGGNLDLIDWSDLSFDEFSKSANASIDAAISAIFGDYLQLITPEDRNLFSRIAYFKVRSRDFMNRYSGIIFSGYGTTEYFPSLIPLYVSFAWHGRLRYYVDDKRSASISLNNPSAVRPFAQTDVIDTLLTGVDPNLGNVFIQNFSKFFNSYNTLILNSIGDTGDIAERIRNLNQQELLQQYLREIQKVQHENYIKPLMAAVSTLSKEDLAEMAESLIYLTYLKRRITFAEETVGGPVDVAVISKGDGFVWIKRKHYFKPELNTHFFANYLRSINP